MATESGSLDVLFDLLVAYRGLVYVGGLFVIGLPLALAWAADIELPWAVRTAVIWVTIGVMVLTYIGERRARRHGVDPERPRDGDTEAYSLRVRLALGFAVVGVAVGGYAALAVNLGLGIVFIAGAVLFAQAAFRLEDRVGEGE